MISCDQMQTYTNISCDYCYANVRPSCYQFSAASLSSSGISDLAACMSMAIDVYGYIDVLYTSMGVAVYCGLLILGAKYHTSIIRGSSPRNFVFSMRPLLTLQKPYLQDYICTILIHLSLFTLQQVDVLADRPGVTELIFLPVFMIVSWNLRYRLASCFVEWS